MSRTRFQIGRLPSKLLFVLCIGLYLSGCITAYEAPQEQVSDCGKFLDYIEKNSNGQFRKQRSKVREYKDSLDQETNYWDLPKAYRSDGPNKPIIVRYSDSGELVNRCDYAAALYAAQNHQDGASNLIVVYVHGWRIHSGPKGKTFYNFSDTSYPTGHAAFAADEIDSRDPMGQDYAGFSRFINNLQEEATLRTKSPGEKKNVIGVFISWKGGTQIPIIDHLSFWNRGGAADRISRSGNLPRLFGALENIRRDEDQIVYLGHSYGARILYNVVEDRLIHEVQDAYVDADKNKRDEFLIDSYEYLDRNKDLVFLINPAFEASLYKSVDAFRYENWFQKEQPPLMVVVTSKDDWANRTFFPLGQVAALRWQKAIRRPVGFLKEFDTHRLCRAPHKCSVSFEDVNMEYWYDDWCDNDHNGVCIVKGVATAPRPKSPQEDKYTPVPKPTPFLFVRAEKDVLTGHGWLSVKPREDGRREPENEAFADWLKAFIADHNCRMSKSDICNIDKERTLK